MNGDLEQLMEDSLAGSALALFAGDALGAPVEGLHLSAIAHHMGWVAEMEAGVRFPAGTYTDDTQLMVGILQALAEDHALPAGLLAQRFAANYEPWRGYGSSTGEALRQRTHDLTRLANLPQTLVVEFKFGPHHAPPSGSHRRRPCRGLLRRAGGALAVQRASAGDAVRAGTIAGHARAARHPHGGASGTARSS